MFFAVVSIGGLSALLTSFHYGRLINAENTSSDAWSVFACATANDLIVLFGIALVMISFSTFPLHRRPMVTRVIALLTCVLIALDFHMLQFRVAIEHGTRAAGFAVMMATMLVFGWGVPHTCIKFVEFANRSRRLPENG